MSELRSSLPSKAASVVLGPWVPDQGNGTYRNPVLWADYSDPDAIRVGDDYWLTASSFNHVPGLPILHSRDLVNWRIVNHALPRLVPVEHFFTPRHGQGVWAPSFRFHAGKFWIFYPDPDFGLYVVTAENPAGRWSEPVLVKAGKGLIDPCPFWDEDGTGYLIHAWAKSRSGIKNRLTLHRLRADNCAVVDAGIVIIDGDQMPGWSTIEGPKLYRRGEYYYVFAPAGGVTDGYQAVLRARSLYGPYEHRIVLARGRTEINGPHQGAWVDTAEGTHGFLHFQEQPAYGRIVHLQPMIWREGWPEMGCNIDAAGTGEPVMVALKPSNPPAGSEVPATTDEFDAADLGLQWQWQANPKPEWLSLTARPGWLRLSAVQQDGTLWAAANLLLQKFPAPAFEVVTRLTASLADGESAGLVVFGYSYVWLGVKKTAGALQLVLMRNDDAHQGGVEREIFSATIGVHEVQLRVRVREGARCEFAFAEGAGPFRPIDATFTARSSYWVGAKVGLFATASSARQQASGHADFDAFRVSSVTT
jgi:beta-xylosidase